MLAAGLRIPINGVLLSLGPIADELKLPIYATTGTAEMLAEENIPCKSVGKHSDDEHTAMELIDKSGGQSVWAYH